MITMAETRTAEVVRTAITTHGPPAPVIYAPRWPADHHPWTIQPGTIRYANYEVRETTPAQ